jgi:hypothetical protein
MTVDNFAGWNEIIVSKDSQYGCQEYVYYRSGWHASDILLRQINKIIIWCALRSCYHTIRRTKMLLSYKHSGDSMVVHYPQQHYFGCTLGRRIFIVRVL